MNPETQNNNNNEIAALKKKMFITIGAVVTVAVVAIGAMAFVMLKPTEEKEVSQVDTNTVTSITSNKSEIDDNGGVVYATMPGYSTTFYLNADKKTVPLVNYDTNTVDMVYEIIYNNESILVTETLKPGEMINADLYTYFGEPGEYELDIYVYTKMPDTGADGYPTSFDMLLVIE